MMRTPTTDTIYDYLTPDEAEVRPAYRRAYAGEYGRLQDRETEAVALLRHWSELAHRNALSRVESAAVQ